MPQFEQPPVRWRLAMEHFFIAKKEEPHRTDHAPVMVDAQVSDLPGAHASDAGNAAGDVLRHASQKPRPGAHSSEASAQLELESASDQAPASADPGLAYVFEHSAGRKCLVFSNSREECEAVTSTLREYCRRAG